MAKTIRMVERINGPGYRVIEPAEFERRMRDGSGRVRDDCLRMEGVDGDEEADTVTYWYTWRPAE